MGDSHWEKPIGPFDWFAFSFKETARDRDCACGSDGSLGSESEGFLGLVREFDGRVGSFQKAAANVM